MGRTVVRFVPLLAVVLVVLLAAVALGFGPHVAGASPAAPCAKHGGVAYARSGMEGGRVWIHIRCKDRTWEEYWY